MDLKLTEKVALITGASRGIGRAIAERLAAEGCDLFLIARGAEGLAQAAEAIRRKSGRRVETAAADLSTLAGVEAAAAAHRIAYGRLDILVNNVGGGTQGPFLDLTDAQWEDAFAHKVFCYVRMSRALWPLLKESKGAVVNISGNFVVTPNHNFMIAGAVGAAMANFSKALAAQGLIDDVNVNVVQPGGTRTEALERLWQVQAKAEGVSVEEVIRRNRSVTGIRRYATPDDVAAAVAFLASPVARQVSGATLVVDGGATKGL